MKKTEAQKSQVTCPRLLLVTEPEPGISDYQAFCSTGCLNHVDARKLIANIAQLNSLGFTCL